METTLMGSDSLGGHCPFSSSTSTTSCSNCQQQVPITNDEGSTSGTTNRRESESYVAVKGQSLIVTKREGQKRGLSRRPSAITLSGSPPQSHHLSKDNTPPEGGSSSDSFVDSCMSVESQSTMTEIERHLHQMTQLLRPEDSIKLVVRLESIFTSRIRYLAVVSCMEQETEEFCLLGIDCHGHITLGLVLAILSHTIIRLDGDGGFCVTYGDGLRSHIFKPVSISTMWSALQSLYRASECAKKNNNFQVSAVRYYDSLFQTNKSEAGCLNEWNLLPGVETKRPMVNMSSDEISFQEKISSTLREILLCEKDLDEVTSKEIRTKLEIKLNTDLSNYKSSIDEAILRIVGQMEAPALILEHLYLGTEWNASHQQDLFDKDIGYILNVTAEIDNFFPEQFRYMNIPVSDTEETDLLRYFNDSYRFINEAHKNGKNVLVHCKMGISRSATIVIAYVMKNRNWDLLQAIEHVKDRRTCVKPNESFMKQLEVYEGILTAKRFSDTLEKRSKSESNLKQSDFTLSSPKEANTSSSNGNLSHSNTMKKSPKKYYNTAPARLKPEKRTGDDIRPFAALLKNKSTLSRPKSCSCAAIPICQERIELSGDDSFLQRDVLDSFQNEKNTVQNLEESLKSSLKKLELSAQSGERSSLPNITDCWLTDQNLSSSVPSVTLSSDKVSNYISQETLVLNQSTEENMTDEPQEPLQQQQCEISVQGETEISEKVENVTESAEPSHFPTPLNVLNTVQISSELDSNNVTSPTSITTISVSASSDQPRIVKVSNLKCCRRENNGYTFSVSPNQVVNISSITDFSKFSVRHLVNEFEVIGMTSNRNSLTSYTPSEIPCFHNTSVPSTTSPITKRSNNTRRDSSEVSENHNFSSSSSSSSSSTTTNYVSKERDTTEMLDKEPPISISLNDEPISIEDENVTYYKQQPAQQLQSYVEDLEQEEERVSCTSSLNENFGQNKACEKEKGYIDRDSHEDCKEDSSSVKGFKIGCLPFFQKPIHTSSSTLLSHNNRAAKEIASNTIVRLIKSHAKRSSENNSSSSNSSSRSREKIKDKGGNKFRSKVVGGHSMNQIKDKFVDKSDTLKNSQPLCNNANILPSAAVFKRTGVVKQRLEAFEAKSVSEQQQYNNRSHNRSHSATGPVSTIKHSSLEKFTHAHRRKSSMPHLNSSFIGDSSKSNSSLNLTHSTSLFDRKGSLDSNTLFRSIPNVNKFTVRGFQSNTNSITHSTLNQPLSNKLNPFNNSTRHQKFTTGSKTRQHGSSHPLTQLLPQTTKLTQ